MSKCWSNYCQNANSYRSAWHPCATFSGDFAVIIALADKILQCDRTEMRTFTKDVKNGQNGLRQSITCDLRRFSPIGEPLRKEIADLSLLLYADELVETCCFHFQHFDCFLCGYLTVPPGGVDRIKVFWYFHCRPAESLPFGLGCRNTLGLALLDSQPLLLSDGPHHLNQDIVHHLKNPRLTFRQIHHGCRKVNHFQAYFSVQSRIVIVLVQIMINRFGPD